MKCTKCQTELEGNRPCRTCGEKPDSSADHFNVSYKKFGASELLEISPKRKAVEPVVPSGQIPRQPKLSRPLRQKPSDEGNKAFLFAAAAVLLVVVITAVFFWFFYSRR